MAAWETGLAPRHGKLVVQGAPSGSGSRKLVNLRACPKHQVTLIKDAPGSPDGTVPSR